LNIYPIITTGVPKDCRDFYKKVLEAVVVFESDWYVHLKIGRWEIGFLAPNPPQRMPVFQHARSTHGLTLAIEVPDVSATFRLFQREGIETLGKPEEFPTGELTFSVVDPAGIVLNFVEVARDTSELVELP
jgi:catechol 2,3-dioxygenase-like lactoylglutathione lyase family enzyme